MVVSHDSSRSDGSGPAPESPVGSVDNALRLLGALEVHERLRVVDVSRLLGVAPSTAHRLLRAFVSQEFLSQDQASKTYGPGPALTRLAVALSRGLDLPGVARPVMAALVEDLGETVHLSVLRGTDVFFVESLETSRPVRVGGREGHLLPAHATASGRVLLAAMGARDLRALMPRRLPATTSRTIGDRDQLESVLARVRDQGYASSLGESEEDVASVAVPVRRRSGSVVAALAIAAPPSRLDAGDIPGIAAALTAGATKIGELLR